jgi:hypothetical protein
MTDFPEMVDENSLKYLEVMLSDETAAARLAAQRALLGLYENTSGLDYTRYGIWRCLGPFTMRLIDRYVKMIGDKDESVALGALILLSSVLSAGDTDMKEAVENSGVFEHIGDIVFNSTPKVRAAVVQFVQQHMGLFEVSISSHKHTPAVLADFFFWEGWKRRD